MRKSVIYNLVKVMIFTAICFSGSYGLSLSSYENYDKYNFIYAEGRFQSGDLYKLKKELRKLDKSKQTIVVFESTGGELNEGIKIGKYLYDHHIGTAVKERSYCASSCAIAFLGGRDKYGDKLMILPRSSRLGYHKFYYKNQDRLTSNTYNEDYANVVNYFNYVGASKKLRDKMLKTKSTDMYWVTQYSKRYIKHLKKTLPFKLTKTATVNKKRNSSYIKSSTKHTKKDQKETVIAYLNSINKVITSKSNIYNKKLALNTINTYLWLESNLEYIKVKKVRKLSRHRVEAYVFYHLKNGLKFTSKNTYKLAKNSRGEWKVLSKKVRPLKYSKQLRKITHKLP